MSPIYSILYFILYNLKDTKLIAEQVRKNIESLAIEHNGNSASKYLTVSCGLYIINGETNINKDNIYKKTDDALYVSKQNGRNQVSIAR